MDGEPIAGPRPVYEALVSGDRVIERIHVARGSLSEGLRRVLDEARTREIPVRRDTRAVLDRLSPSAAHQGVVAITGSRGYVSLESLVARAERSGPPALFVVLDEVQDPRNLGAVIRTAETAGASGVIVAARRSAPLSATVAKTSAGAIEHVPVARVGNVVNALKTLKKRGLWVVGLDPTAPEAWTGFDYTVPVALVLGGEHRGIRPVVGSECDVRVHLPVRGRVASLNVSVAAGVALYEVVRQRREAPAPGESSAFRRD